MGVDGTAAGGLEKDGGFKLNELSAKNEKLIACVNHLVQEIDSKIIKKRI